MELLEEFKVLLLNRQNRVLGVLNVAQGGFSEVSVDPKVIFSAALKACANGIILSHNHPSSELRPSEADVKLTTRMVECGKLLGVEVHDHIILSAYGYYSFMDEGMI